MLLRAFSETPDSDSCTAASEAADAATGGATLDSTQAVTAECAPGDDAEGLPGIPKAAGTAAGTGADQQPDEASAAAGISQPAEQPGNARDADGHAGDASVESNPFHALLHDDAKLPVEVDALVQAAEVSSRAQELQT
jgi:hypothetical protein